MIELLKRISENEIVIDINEGELELSSHKTDIDQELLSEIRNNKEELTSYLIKHKSLAFNKIEYQKIPKCKDDISYPLSNAQLRLWLTNRIGDGAIAFNIPKSIILNGEYDVSCFQKAIHAVIERHEILRTVFKVNSKDEVRQYILSSQELGFYIDYKDYRGENNPESVVETYISSDSYKPFDLEKGPLLRASLLQLADDQYVFYYNMHHIISDEWSKDVLSRDVMRYYESYASGNKPDITQLSIQYKDYAAWQLDQLSSPVYQDHKRYWLERLSGELPVIEIPSNRPRPKVKTGNGRSLNTFLSEGLTNQLNEFIKVEDGSLFTLALAAINVLIYKYTSNRDIIIGSPVTERDHPDLEDQIGFYVNVLTSRNNIDLTDSFIDFHKRVKEGALNDFTHKQYPFDKLVEDLELKYDQGRSPVYDISLTIHNYQDISLKDTNGKIQDKGEVACKFDIEFHIAPFENNTSLEIFYNTDVYDKVMISKMMEHFKQLLSSLLSAPNELLSNIEYLIPDERRKLLHEFNSNQVNHPINKTIVDLFVEQAQKAPDSIALKFEEENLTYKELDERSNQLARYLQKEGVTQETLVPICIERSIEMIVGILGIIKAGGAYVPIDPEYPEKRINYILTEIDSKIVLTSKKSRSVLDEFRYLKIISFAFEDLNIVSLDQDWELINKESTSSYTPKVSPSDLAYIIYTSGSTGDPKGVMVEHRSVFNHILHHSKEFDINTSDNILLFSNFAFDASVEQIFLALTNGSSLVLIDKEALLDSNLFKKVLNENKVTHLHATPSYLNHLPFDNYKALKRVVAGGEYCPSSLAELWGSRYIFYNEYGPTETTITSVEYKYDPKDSSLCSDVSIGRPISNTQVYIFDSNLNIVPIGVVGELCISGAGLARGYYNSPELTAEKFIDHPFEEGLKLYKTGDFARWLPSGDLQFIGRKDHQVKIRGYRIELGEIESALARIESIEQSVVLAREDGNGLKQLVAYIVSKGEVNHVITEQKLKEHLPEYMIPKIYVSIDQIPLTKNGKIDHKALPVSDKGIYNKQEYVEPTSETEVKIVKIWEDVFGIEKIGVKDDFFDIGGNSLSAVKIIARIRKELDIELSVKTLFDFNTIVDLAQQIDFSLKREELKLKAHTIKQIM